MKDYWKKVRRASYARTALALEFYLKRKGVDAELSKKTREELQSYLIPFPFGKNEGDSQ